MKKDNEIKKILILSVGGSTEPIANAINYNII